jgi:rubrerythrin
VMQASRGELVRGLRRAHAGEAAAALAYARHADRMSGADADAVRQVERDEWRHRAELVEMLYGLGSRPSPSAELAKFALGFALWVVGVFAPSRLMNRVAAHLELRGAAEYLALAALAERVAPELAVALRIMAEVESEHATLFLRLAPRRR